MTHYYSPFDDQKGFREAFLEVDGSTHEVYSIGDIHGCIDEFRLLLAKIEIDADFRGKKPIIVIHGDMIDRGPSFQKVIELAKDKVCILGNHEHNFVLERLGKPCNSNSRAVSHEKFESMSKLKQQEVIDFFNGLYNFVEVWINDEQRFMLSHAPLKTMETGYDMYSRSRSNAPYYCMRSSTPDDELMKELWEEVTFVYGHQSWNFKDLEIQKNEQAGRRAQYYNIDGGCVYGGKLIALRLSDLGVLSVQSNVSVAKH